MLGGRRAPKQKTKPSVHAISKWIKANQAKRPDTSSRVQANEGARAADHEGRQAEPAQNERKQKRAHTPLFLVSLLLLRLYFTTVSVAPFFCMSLLFFFCSCVLQTTTFCGVTKGAKHTYRAAPYLQRTESSDPRAFLLPRALAGFSPPAFSPSVELNSRPTTIRVVRVYVTWMGGFPPFSLLLPHTAEPDRTKSMKKKESRE